MPESANRALAKCISRCVILPIFETWASNCNIYIYIYIYTEGILFTRVFFTATQTRLGQASGTREGRYGGSNLSSLRRALQSTMATDAHRRPCIEDKRLSANVSVAQRSVESSDKRASFRVTYSGLSVLRPGHSSYEATSQRWRGHKSAGRGVPRTRHCVFSEQRSHR